MSEAEQSFSTMGVSLLMKAESLQMQAKSVSWQPVELRLVNAALLYGNLHVS